MRLSSIINRQSQIFTQFPDPAFYQNPSPLKKISSEEQIKINKENRKRIIKQMRDSQLFYIAQLKLIEFRIKMPFQQDLKIEASKVRDMFGDIPKFIQFHTTFVNNLSKIVDNPQDHDNFLPKIFDKFFQFLIIYVEYISKIESTVSQLQKICTQNSEMIRKLFIDFQQPLQHYMTLPITHITNYSTFLNKYIDSLESTHCNYESMCKSKDAYNFILTHRLNLSSCQGQEGCNELVNSFKEQMSQKGDLQLLFEEEVYIQEQPRHVYILQAEKETIINIGCSSRLERISKIQKYHSIKVVKQTFLIPFADSVHYSNRIGICNYNQFVVLRFHNHNRMKAFYEKCRILQGGAILKNYTDQYIYESRVNDFSLAFCFSGVIFRRNDKKQPKSLHVIRLFDHRTKICQYFFATLAYIQQTINHISKNLKINLADDDFFMKNIIYSDQELEQRKWMKLQNSLNVIVRNKQFRKHSEYLFHKFKIFEGFWKIITQQQQHCECLGCQQDLKQMDISQLQLLVQKRQVQTQKKIICPSAWVIARQQLAKQLIEKSKVIKQKDLTLTLKYRQKLQLCYLQFQKINYKMNRFYKKLKDPRKINIKYYNIHGKQQQLIVQQNFQQETVENLMIKIDEKLKLQFYRDFCLYSINAGHIVQYEDHEYINAIYDTFVDLHFGKKIYFSSKIEEGLISDVQYQNVRVSIIVGDIVSKIQFSPIMLEVDTLKNYLVYILEFYFHQKQIYCLQEINLNFLRKHLHVTLQNSINFALLEEVKMELKQLLKKNRILKNIYRDLIEIFHKSEQSVLGFRAHYLKTIIACSTVYDSIEVICRFNFQGIKITPVKNIPQIKFNHWEYSLSIIGTLLCIRLKNRAKEESIWIKFENSFFVWKKITIYKRMYQETKEKTSSGLDNQKINEIKINQI